MSQASDLDEMYGAVISPASISSLESNLNSVGQTHQVLDAWSAQGLVSYMACIGAAFLSTWVLSNSVRFLWVIDETGMIRIGLEEYLDLQSSEPVSIRPDGLPHSVTFGTNGRTAERIGHPALSPTRRARIGGELYFDTRDGEWVLSNGSGRFGRRATSSSLQLDNARRAFAVLGISASLDYIEM